MTTRYPITNTSITVPTAVGTTLLTAADAAAALSALGGATNGSGTFASRPASPALGDRYTVTSGARTGSVYQCLVAGSWRLVNILPLINSKPEIICVDAERLLEVGIGERLMRWDTFTSGPAVPCNVNVINGSATVTAASWGGLPYAQYPTVGTATTPAALSTWDRGPIGPAQPRTLAVLVSSVPNWVSNQFTQNVGGWGAANNGAWTIRVNCNASNTTGLSLYGTDPIGTGPAPTGTTPTLLVGTYTGTQYALYQTPIDTDSWTTSVAPAAATLAGTPVTGRGLVIGCHSWDAATEFFRGRLHGLWVWSATLDATERSALRAAIATRYA